LSLPIPPGNRKGAAKPVNGLDVAALLRQKLSLPGKSSRFILAFVLLHPGQNGIGGEQGAYRNKDESERP
jgi:hypothetical protein